jgi:hypothetical protein
MADTDRAMQLRMHTRLTELRHQHELGERQLAELTAQQAALRETLLRISGAITVLEELLDPDPGPAVTGQAPGNGATATATTGRSSP